MKKAFIQNISLHIFLVCGIDMDIDKKLAEVNSQIDELSEKIGKLVDEREQLEMQKLNLPGLEGKYIETICFDKGFMYAKTVWFGNDLDGKRKFFIQGPFYNFEDSPYSDANYIRYDALYTWSISLDTLKRYKSTKLFKEITKEQFINGYLDMIDTMKDNGLTKFA